MCPADINRRQGHALRSRVAQHMQQQPGQIETRNQTMQLRVSAQHTTASGRVGQQTARTYDRRAWKLADKVLLSPRFCINAVPKCGYRLFGTIRRHVAASDRRHQDKAFGLCHNRLINDMHIAFIVNKTAAFASAQRGYYIAARTHGTECPGDVSREHGIALQHMHVDRRKRCRISVLAQHRVHRNALRAQRLRKQQASASAGTENQDWIHRQHPDKDVMPAALAPSAAPVR